MAARTRRIRFGCMVYLHRVVQADKIFEVFGNPERLFDAWGSLLPAPQVNTSCMARTHSSQSAVTSAVFPQSGDSVRTPCCLAYREANNHPCPKQRYSKGIADQPDTARSSAVSQAHPCGSARRKRRSRYSLTTSWPSPPLRRETPLHHGGMLKANNPCTAARGLLAFGYGACPDARPRDDVLWSRPAYSISLNRSEINAFWRGVGNQNAEANASALDLSGSSTWTRTRNPPVNSRMLCQLSYRGSTVPIISKTGCASNHPR